MKILYGVVGEGMGHAMRSRVVLEHLVAQGHEIQIMASGRAKDFLEKRFTDVNRIHGFHLIYEENRVRLGRTLWSNVQKGAAGVPTNIAAYFDLISERKPELVISDFESWTYLYGKSRNLPILSIDNMQIINRCELPKEVTAGVETDFQLAKAFVKSKLPFCQHYLITTFFRPPVRKDKTTLVPPILRPEIVAAKPTRGEHVLVYQTAEGGAGLVQTLARTGIECRIYGVKRDLKEDEVVGNLRYRPFSEKGFIDDLASCRAVIAGGGFTLMGEAVYLKKPMLAVPLGRQFEQVLNARYLEKVGFGRAADDLEDPKDVLAFLEAIPACEEKLAGYVQEGNKEMLGTLDGLLDKAAAGLLSG
ncbi:MAG: MJ1255/VC2487 family glycosyltransferase [Polyangiaceae bacterium]